jgi:hypothetical protein
MKHFTMRALVAFVYIVAASHSAANASCNVAGTWTLVHADGTRVSLEVRQTCDEEQCGTRLSGDGVDGTRIAQMTGKTDGNTVDFEITWDREATGVYNGVMGRHGMLSGIMYRKDRSAYEKELWHIEQRFSRCKTER